MGTLSIQVFPVAGRGIAKDLRRNEMKQLTKLYHIPLVEGTLNLVSEEPVWLDTRKTIFSAGIHHYFFAKLNGLPVVVNRWSQSPAHIFEIMSQHHLRTKLNLSDGDLVELEFDDSILDKQKNSSWKNFIAWEILWRKRESWFYKDGYYRIFTRNNWVKRLFSASCQ